MQQSTETAELYAALAAAQAEITNPSKDKIAKVPTKTGGSYSYSYADIADVLNTVRPVLARHGLAVMQLPVMAAGDLLLRTRIAHKSGQWIESEYPVCQIGGDHRVMGAALTYARRYALCPMLGIAADEDTDGETAADAPRRQAKAPPAPPPAHPVQDSRPPSEAIAYAAEAETEIMNADNASDLVAWWSSDEQKTKRRAVALPADMLASLKEAVQIRIAELGGRHGVNGGAH